MLQACLNGGRAGPGVPVTAEALAAAAYAARAAGATEFHIHPRDSAGSESLAPHDIAACLKAMREAVPGAPLGVGTGAWIAPGGRKRHAHIAAWQERPDYASVNLNEEDAPDIIDLLRRTGIGVEAGIWSEADAQRFVETVDPTDCLRILIEMPDTEPELALAEAAAVIDVLEKAGINVPILLHGEGQSAWSCVRRACDLGYDTRIGLEDVLFLPDGSAAVDNAALVAAAQSMLAASERKFA